MKDTKHIRQAFHLATSVMPKGWDFGIPWVVGESKIIEMKDSNHFRQDFHSVALIMPQRSDFSGTGGFGVIFFSKIQPNLVCK